MQPVPVESYVNVSRRSLDIEDYVDVVRRHKGWIFGPAFAGLVIAVVTAFLWPETFVSRATIRVVPPLVPQNYVATNVNSEMSQRVNSMYQNITNRTNLTNMINELGLYEMERKSKPIDDVVEMMRGAIGLGDVVPVGGPRANGGMSAFSITFAYGNRYTAQKVTQRLVGRFMTENQRERTSQSNQTTQFLSDQFESAKKDLQAIEDRLTKFRTTYAGKLPEQVQMNQSQLGMLEQRISNLNMQINRGAQEKMLLESDLRAYKAQRATIIPPPEQAAQMQKSEELASVERRIAQLQFELEVMRQNYTDSYPDVRRRQAELNTHLRARDRLQAMEVEAATQAANQPAKPSGQRYNMALERERVNIDSGIDKVQNLLKSKEGEITQYNKAIAEAEGQVKAVQTRLDSFPASLQQYAEVVRDRDVAKAKYDEFNMKMNTSSTAEELEKRNQGETLEMLDSASLPSAPIRPKRPLMIGMGAGLGFALGCVLAGVREAKDTALKNLKDVRAYTQLTILGSVPLLENDLVVQRRRRFAWLAWSTASLVGVAIMTGSLLYYYTTKA